jgi:predicted nucleic acid-binding protein
VGIKEAAWSGRIGKLSRVGIDSSVLIYHLEDIPPYADLTEALFAAVSDGSLGAVISTVSVTELFVRPFSENRFDRVSALERFLFSLPNIDLVAPDYTISREAARLRAQYGIRTPDAMILATSLKEKAEALVTNDARLKRIKEEGLEILLLEDFIDR